MTQEDLIIGLIYIMADEKNPELINMLQKSSVLVNSESSSDSILYASLNALKDSPSFRQNLNNYFIKEFNSLIEKISYSNSKNYKLTLENLEKLEYYNNKVNIDNINEKFDSITRFIPAYIILIFMSIYILSKCLKSNFTTISFIIILIYTFLISTYTIKKHLE